MLALDVLPSPLRPLRVITPDPLRSAVHLDSGEADLYRPRGFSRPPALVLVHGANPEGKDDKRVVNLSQAFARVGRRVIVPQLGLRNHRLDREDTERIREAIISVAGGGKAGVLAFSYGGGLAIVGLAERPEVQRRVGFVATVGTYFDLLHLIQGVTTGTSPYHGRPVPWRTDPRALEVITEQLASFLDGAEGAALERAWETRRAEGLGAEPAAIYDLLSNKDPNRVRVLAERLPARIRDLLSAYSPSKSVDRISVPVYALHSREDPAAPATESRLLVEALRERVETRHVEVGILRHVSVVASPFVRLGDGLSVTRFAGWILAAQEGWPRP